VRTAKQELDDAMDHVENPFRRPACMGGLVFSGNHRATSADVSPQYDFAYDFFRVATLKAEAGCKNYCHAADFERPRDTLANHTESNGGGVGRSMVLPSPKGPLS
jgi:hypothetical protein